MNGGVYLPRRFSHPNYGGVPLFNMINSTYRCVRIVVIDVVHCVIMASTLHERRAVYITRLTSHIVHSMSCIHTYTTMYTIHYSANVLHCIIESIYSIRCTFYIIRYTLYNYIAQCTLYAVHCTVFIVYYTMYIV